jgi:hypothetical protein
VGVDTTTFVVPIIYSLVKNQERVYNKFTNFTFAR